MYLVFCLSLISSCVTTQGPFYIWFERSGGFAGISTSVEIASESLPPDEVEELRKLIDQSGFFEFIKNDSVQAELPDQYQYKITIEYEGEKQTVEFSESTVPDSFHPLVNYLTRKARSKMKD